MSSSSAANPQPKNRAQTNFGYTTFRLRFYGATGRTKKQFALKENPLKRSNLDDFVNCYFGRGNSPNRPRAVEVNRRYLSRHERKESERFKSFTYDELTRRDKPNLDIFWLKDESLEDSANLPDPDVIAEEIVEDLEAALSQLKFARCPTRSLLSSQLYLLRRWPHSLHSSEIVADLKRD